MTPRPLAATVALSLAAVVAAAHPLGPAHASGTPADPDRSPAQVRTASLLELLPEPLRNEAVTAARRAAARHADAAPPLPPLPSDGVPELDWDVTNGWRVDWDGRTGVDLGLSARTVLVDPRAEFDRAAARLDRRRAVLEAELATDDAVAAWAEHRLALWRTDRRLEIVRAAARLPPPSDPDAARALASLRAIEPDLHHDRERLVAWLQRHAGPADRSRAPATGPFPDPGAEAWAGWTDRPHDPDPHTCTGGRADLRLARLALDEARARAADGAAFRPSVTLGASADLAVSAIGTSAPSLGARIWLEVGAPALWPLSGSARTEVDPTGATVRLRAAGASGAAEPDRRAQRSAQSARAEQVHADAAFRAAAWAHATEHALRSARSRLRELGPAPDAPPRRPAHAAAALEAAWERTDLEARIASLAIDLDRTCAAASAR